MAPDNDADADALVAELTADILDILRGERVSCEAAIPAALLAATTDIRARMAEAAAQHVASAIRRLVVVAEMRGALRLLDDGDFPMPAATPRSVMQ